MSGFCRDQSEYGRPTPSKIDCDGHVWLIDLRKGGLFIEEIELGLIGRESSRSTRLKSLMER